MLFITGCTSVINKGTSKDTEDNKPAESVDESKGDTATEDSDSKKEAPKQSKPKYKKITPKEAKEMMVEDNLILDVRTQSEYDQIHIEGSLLLPVDQIIKGKLDSLPDKDQTILIYCRSGNRSKTAAKALIKAGYTDVYDFGGINKWPYDTVSK